MPALRSARRSRPHLHPAVGPFAAASQGNERGCTIYQTPTRSAAGERARLTCFLVVPPNDFLTYLNCYGGWSCWLGCSLPCHCAPPFQRSQKALTLTVWT